MMAEKQIVKLCWFHSILNQYIKVFDPEKIIVENVGGDYDSCILCKKYGKMKNLEEVV